MMLFFDYDVTDAIKKIQAEVDECLKVCEKVIFKKPNNNAPKSIKGDYDLSIHGNKIVLVDNVDGVTIETKCHPEDNFDIGIGMTEAFNKLNAKKEEIKKRKLLDQKIKVGDTIKVIDAGYGYTQYYQWLPYDSFELIKKFDFGRRLTEGMIGTVKYIGKHPNDNATLIYFEDKKGLCHTIDIKGVEKIKKD